MTTGTALLWAADSLAVLACADVVVRLVAGEREHLRLYGWSPGRVRFHRPVFRRVPGLPRDGVLTVEEEAAIGDIERQLTRDRRQ
jgi:hypothetical protein